MERTDVERWIDAYVRAWASNDRSHIGALFTDAATYYTAPYREPWRGRDTIVDGWLGRKDEPGQWEFRYDVLAVSGDLGFVQGVTRYRNPPIDYSNLWVIRLGADGRCSEFTEWWMEHDRSTPSS
jgi:ketosteroid isomerase-like protein